MQNQTPRKLGMKYKTCVNVRPPLADHLKNPKKQPKKTKPTASTAKVKPKHKQEKKVNTVLYRPHKAAKLKKDEEMFTTVLGLHGFLQDGKKDIIDLIVSDVLELSAITVESSRMIYCSLTTMLRRNPNAIIDEKPNFRTFFNSLVKTKMKPHIDTTNNEEYLKHRKSNQITHMYSGAHRTEMIALAADAYETQLHNSIITHMYKRVKQFFSAVHKDVSSYHTLGYLFDPSFQFQPNPKLLAALRHELNFASNFHYMNQHW